jgi:hypothetical protein
MAAISMRTECRLRIALVLVALLCGLQSTSAHACRGYRGWSTGADLGKLKPGEIVVRAKLIQSYKGEQTIPSIMGSPHGMMYFVQITKVAGGAEGAGADLGTAGTAQIYVRLQPSICEQYAPRDFVKDGEKTFVLRKGIAGIYDLVGGQE